jgi:hypothetical protein
MTWAWGKTMLKSPLHSNTNGGDVKMGSARNQAYAVVPHIKILYNLSGGRMGV